MIQQDLEKIHCIEEIAQKYDTILFDVWGVIIMDSSQGRGVNPKIVDRVNRLIASKNVYFVSNYSCSSQSLELKLQNLGINIVPESAFTAGRVAKEILSDSNYLSKFFSNYKSAAKPLFFQLGADEDCNILPNVGFTKTDNLKDASLLLISAHKKPPEQNDPQIIQILKDASVLNVPAVCINPDAHFVGPNGTVDTYCAGYFAARYERMGGTVLYIGKPFEQIFLHVFQQANLRPKLNKILMVGDTLTTDVLGGRNAGIDTALVTTGNAAAYTRQNPDDVDSILSQIRLHCQLNRIYPTYVVSMST
jgi:HAD superfamily hydrolase (TIGR01459 family)